MTFDRLSMNQSENIPQTPMLAKYDVIREVGSGSTANVKIAKLDGSGAIHAIKAFRQEYQDRAFHSETEALQAVHWHPFIVGLHGVSSETSPTLGKVHLVAMEYASRGDLFHYMKSFGPFPTKVAQSYAFQLLSALSACHDQGIAHRDIKPENIFVHEDWSLRLGDFGFACRTETVARDVVGTRGYMSPEIVSLDSYTRVSNGFTKYDATKSDVWSLGVILFTFLMGNPPVEHATREDWFFRAMSNGRWERFWAAHERFAPRLDRQAKEFLQRLLEPLEQDRASVIDLLQDPWICEADALDQSELAQFMQASSEHRH